MERRKSFFGGFTIDLSDHFTDAFMKISRYGNFYLPKKKKETEKKRVKKVNKKPQHDRKEGSVFLVFLIIQNIYPPRL